MSRWLRQHQADLPNTGCFQQLSFLGEGVLALLQNLLQLSISVVEQSSVGHRREGVLSQHHMQKVQGHRSFASLQSHQGRQILLQSAFHLLQLREQQHQAMSLVSLTFPHREELCPCGGGLLDGDVGQLTGSCQPVQVGLDHTLLHLGI
eukprot:Skav203843  [mRNA]  locus=scaffold5703:29534:30461:- [translate_table: standard]